MTARPKTDPLQGTVLTKKVGPAAASATRTRGGKPPLRLRAGRAPGTFGESKRNGHIQAVLGMSSAPNARQSTMMARPYIQVVACTAINNDGSGHTFRLLLSCNTMMAQAIHSGCCMSPGCLADPSKTPSEDCWYVSCLFKGTLRRFPPQAGWHP